MFAFAWATSFSRLGFWNPSQNGAPRDAVHFRFYVFGQMLSESFRKFCILPSVEFASFRLFGLSFVRCAVGLYVAAFPALAGIDPSQQGPLPMRSELDCALKHADFPRVQRNQRIRVAFDF